MGRSALFYLLLTPRWLGREKKLTYTVYGIVGSIFTTGFTHDANKGQCKTKNKQQRMLKIKLLVRLV